MIVIKKGRWINPATKEDEIQDIFIDDGTIKMFAKNISFVGSIEINAEGMIVAPGLVDSHAHFRDPGFTDKEDIFSGARAAEKGGYTSVILMANTYPPVDCPDILRFVLEEGKKTGIHIHSCANVTQRMEGKELVDMAALAAAGAIGFSDDGRAIADGNLAKMAMKMAAKVGLPISFHEENRRFVRNEGINQGYASEALGCKGSPRKAEISMISRDLDNAIHTGAKVVIQHVSTMEGVDIIRKAKVYNPLIYAEATPHHFTLTEETLVKKGANAKVNPPLRTEEDRLAIIEGLKDGTIDIIATDHAPHTVADKNGKITMVPSGMIGLETALSLGIRELVNPGHLTFPELLNKMSVNPAQLYGLKAGDISRGKKADLVIFDPNETWTVKSFMSRSRNSPFYGETLPGVVRYTICGGKIVYQA